MSYIFRDSDSVKNCEIADAHNGKGIIYVQQLLGYEKSGNFSGSKEDFEAPVNFVHRVTLPPGSEIGNHPHPNNEEFYYVISGVGQMIVDGKVFNMPAGSICLIKKGSEHSFSNVSDNDVTIMVMEVEFSK